MYYMMESKKTVKTSVEGNEEPDHGLSSGLNRKSVFRNSRIQNTSGFFSMNRNYFLLVLMGFTAALATTPCCDNDQVVLPGAYCDVPDSDKTKVLISCPFGYLPLKDIIIIGNKVFTKDSGSFSFASDPNDYCIGEILIDRSYPEKGRIQIALVCFEQDDSGTVNIEVTGGGNVSIEMTGGNVSIEMTGGNVSIKMTGYLTLISAFFLSLTFSVYMFLPQLRDIQGLCYMCLCISMALGFLSLGILQLNPRFITGICTVTGSFVYFWMLATFFWINVICINVYYMTVVDANYLKKMKRRHYFVYSGYAWGGAIGFLIKSLITNFTEGDHIKPGFGENSCWFHDRISTWAHFYGPVAVLLMANVILFVSSFRNLWTQSRNYEVNIFNNLKYKFILSLKLMLVMGISWIFEIVSFAHREYHVIWIIMDVFNSLQGVVIFLLLVVLRRRAIKGFADAGICLFVTRPLAERLSSHDDADDQQILLDDEHTEVRLN